MNSGSSESLKVSVAQGFEPEGPPDATDGRLAHPCRLGHVARRPVGGALGLVGQGLDHEGLDVIVTELAGNPGSGFVVQALESPLDEPASPFADRRSIDTEALCDLTVAEPFRAGQHDLASQGQGLLALSDAAPNARASSARPHLAEARPVSVPVAPSLLPSLSTTGATRRTEAKFLSFSVSLTQVTSRRLPDRDAGSGVRREQSPQAFPSRCPTLTAQYANGACLRGAVGGQSPTEPAPRIVSVRDSHRTDRL